MGLTVGTGSVEGSEQEVARTITAKHSSGPVRAMGSGCKADDQPVGVRVAKVGNRSPPVLLGSEGLALFLGNFADVHGESRAPGAGYNALIKLRRRVAINFWSH